MIKKIKIPEERIPVLIGHAGEIKKGIEKCTKTKISVNEEVLIEGDAIDVLMTENIIKAVGRGFSPEIAMKLADEEKYLLVIPLPKDRKELKRLKSRLIGTKGKCRKNIELLTKTNLSVYGKTVSIIGRYDDVEKARMAIKKLISGMTHKSVYKFLESR
jgi:ribosomal RNA assembly protein